MTDMFTLAKRENQFKQELNDFEAMLNKDLNARVSETTKKFAFDFTAEEPMKDGESPFTWEKNAAPLQVRQEPICRLQPKQKISVDAIINQKNSDNARFSLVGRSSIFSSEAPTESTACNSKLEDSSRIDSGVSILSGSILGFNLEMDNSLNQSGFDLRPTVGLGCKFNRRATYGGTILEDSRESIDSINHNRASELEGTINTTNDQVTNIKSASKAGSVNSYANVSPRDGPMSNRSNGSPGQKRDLMMRNQTRQFDNADPMPFTPVNEKPQSSEELKEKVEDEDNGEADADEATPVIAEWQEQQQNQNRTILVKETKPGPFETKSDK